MQIFHSAFLFLLCTFFWNLLSVWRLNVNKTRMTVQKIQYSDLSHFKGSRLKWKHVNDKKCAGQLDGAMRNLCWLESANNYFCNKGCNPLQKTCVNNMYWSWYFMLQTAVKMTNDTNAQPFVQNNCCWSSVNVTIFRVELYMGSQPLTLLKQVVTAVGHLTFSSCIHETNRKDKQRGFFIEPTCLY